MNTPIYPPIPFLGRAFSPSSLSSLKLWMDAGQTLYSDAAGTTPATTDGTSVLNVPDRSGVGNTMTRPSGTGPKLRIENSLRVLSFEAAGYLNCAVTSGTLSAFSLHLAYKPVAPGRPNPVMSFGSAGANPAIAPNWINAEFESTGISTVNNYCACPHATDPNYRIISLTFDGSLLHTYVDGAEIGPSAATQAVAGQSAAAFTRAGYCIGKETTFNNAGNYRVPEMVLCEAYQSATTVRTVQSYLRNKWSGLFNATDKQVVYVMNSLGTALAVPENSAVPYLCFTGSTKIKLWVTACRPSITTPQMTARVSGDYSYYVAGPTPRIAAVWEGTNDLSANSVSGATGYANLVTLAQALKAVGYTKIVMGTMLPRGAGVETARTALNTAIRADTTNWDAVADVGGDATIGAAGANTNLTYYNADAVHLKAAGNLIAAPYFQAAIDSLLP